MTVYHQASRVTEEAGLFLYADGVPKDRLPGHFFGPAAVFEA